MREEACASVKDSVPKTLKDSQKNSYLFLTLSSFLLRQVKTRALVISDILGALTHTI